MSMPRSFTTAMQPWLFAEGGKMWSFIPDGTAGLDDAQRPMRAKINAANNGARVTACAHATSASDASRLINLADATRAANAENNLL